MQIIIHIGQQKTASSFIQHSLRVNKKILASQGFFVGRFKKIIRDFYSRNEILRENAQKIILSNENLYRDNANRNAILLREAPYARDVPKFLKNLLKDHATSWKIICYLRRPDEHIVSQYQQKVKSGFIGSLDDLMNFRSSDDYYRYAQRMEHWTQVFGEDAMDVRLFHRNALQGDPFQDFLRLVGIDYEKFPFVTQEPINESLDRINTEILRLLNWCRLNQPKTLREQTELGKKDLLAMLRATNTGDRLQLDPERARRLQEWFHEDHKQLAQRYLSPEHASVLLAPPADVPPQPPLDREILSERTIALFNNPDLARFAVERVGQSGGALWARGTGVGLGDRAKRFVTEEA